MKKVKKGKGGKDQMSRKQKPIQRKQAGWNSKNNIKLTKNINRNSEEIMITRATEGKIRLKIAGQKRSKKWWNKI